MIRIRSFLTVGIALLAGCTSEQEQPPASAVDFDVVAFADDFESGSIIGMPRVVECTLSGGATTSCVAVTLPADPETFDIGPWCPVNNSDSAEDGGIWLEDGQVWDVDGSFIENLAAFYGDGTWQMFDPETGAVNVTDSREACAAAARPDVDPQYTNYCVQCLASYVEEGLTTTYVIPITPVAAPTVEPRIGHEGVGISFSGTRLDAPAPTDDILGAYTLAPFDDCGGHVNLAVGYHTHAVTDCLREIPTESGHAARIGISLDGYPLHARLNPDGIAPSDLNACLGHTTVTEGYHYHVGEAGSNAILGCHSGQTGCALEDPDAPCNASLAEGPGGRGGPPEGGRPPPADGRPARGGPPPGR